MRRFFMNDGIFASDTVNQVMRQSDNRTKTEILYKVRNVEWQRGLFVG